MGSAQKENKTKPVSVRNRKIQKLIVERIREKGFVLALLV